VSRFFATYQKVRPERWYWWLKWLATVLLLLSTQQSTDNKNDLRSATKPNHA
jgi:hypothetical protein